MIMWPLLLDMTKEECIQSLRNLELEAYAQLVSVLRAQGPLSVDKRKLLKDTGQLLNISGERHKAEVRRAINDEKLNTIAYHVTGNAEITEDWAQEGRRLMPLLPRTAPQTAFSALADEVAESANQCNKQLPSTSSTERKRQTIQSMPMVPETSKTIPFRIPDPPKTEESKKRKLTSDSSSLAQHLLAPKVCRIQQLYRQRSKGKPKDIHKKPEQEQEVIPQHRVIQTLPQQNSTFSSAQSQVSTQKLNVLQNITLVKEEQEQEDTVYISKPSDQVQNTPTTSFDNQASKPKIISNVKPNSSITIKPTNQVITTNNEIQKTIKVCSTKKPITKTVSTGQKLIVVSNAQTIPTNSILQRTLQIPFAKNVSIKNLEKFKIVTSNSSPTSITVANVTNSGINPVKHKVVTVKTNSATKKVIPLSQLQLLNSKGSIKVLPLGGKIVGKTVGTSSPLYIVNTNQQLAKSTHANQIITSNKIQSYDEIKTATSSGNIEVNETSSKENGQSVLNDAIKTENVTEETEDYDHKIEEFRIPQTKKEADGDIKGIKEETDNEKHYVILPAGNGHEQPLVSNIKVEAEEQFSKTEEIMNEVIESENLVKNETINFNNETSTEVSEMEQDITDVDSLKPSDIIGSN